MNYEYENATEENAIYRSVILSVPDERDPNFRLLSFSPPNSMELPVFRNKYPELTADFFVNEVIEGTMIHLFFDDRIQQRQIATRSSVGGNYWYYRNQYPGDLYTIYQPTFRQMFLDAVKCATVHEFGESMHLLQNRSYCFVLQHPANHIVQNHAIPALYLVAVYELRGLTAIHVPMYDRSMDVGSNRIQIPDTVDIQNISYTGLMEKILTINNKSMGYMILNKVTGERTVMTNPAYEYLKELRGNHPNLQYQYLVLKKSDKVMEFINEFPQYRNLFFRFYQQYSDFVTNVHNAYVSYYVKKSGEKIPKSIFMHVYKIHHEVFLKSNGNGNDDDDSNDDGNDNGNNQLIKHDKKIIKRKVVDEYMTQMEPGSLLYYLTHVNKVE